MRLHLAGLVAGDVEQAGLVRDLALRHAQLRVQLVQLRAQRVLLGAEGAELLDRVPRRRLQVADLPRALVEPLGLRRDLGLRHQPALRHRLLGGAQLVRLLLEPLDHLLMVGEQPLQLREALLRHQHLGW